MSDTPQQPFASAEDLADEHLSTWAPPELPFGSPDSAERIRLATWVSFLDREVAGLRRGRHKAANAINRIEGKLVGLERRLAHLEARVLGGTGALLLVAEVVRQLLAR